MNFKDYIRCKKIIYKAVNEVLRKIYIKDESYKDTKRLIISIDFDDDGTSIKYDYVKGENK